jgi:hypothetical protein
MLALLPAYAQQDEQVSALLRVFAPIPLSTQIAIPNAVAQNVDLRFGVAVYPIPLLLESELNFDAAVNVAYSAGGAPLALYLGAGPRFSLVNSTWLPGVEAVGSYVGAGAAAGLELGFDFLGVVLEASGDVLYGITAGATPMRFVPRLKVGFNLPVIGTVSPL